MPIKFKIESFEDITIIKMPMNAIDAGNILDFKTDIAPILDKCDQVIFDMTRIKFVDSSGIGVILSCMRKLHSQGGSLAMCGVRQQLIPLLKLVRLDRIIDIYPTRKAAVKAIQGD